MTVKRKLFKAMAVGYFWLCLAAGFGLISIILAACLSGPQTRLTKVSLDGKYLARLSGGIYDRRVIDLKVDPKFPSGIYIEKKSSHERWLVAQQNNSDEYLCAEEVDAQWGLDDSLAIETNEIFSLPKSELVIDGQRIKISLVHAPPKEQNN